MRRAIEFYNDLTSGKCVSFFIDKRNAKIFKVHTERLNRSEVLLSQSKGMYGRVVAYLYASHVGIVGFAIGAIHKDLEIPLLVYTTCWRHIAFIEGTDLPDGKAEITFCGRINEN